MDYGLIYDTEGKIMDPFQAIFQRSKLRNCIVWNIVQATGDLEFGAKRTKQKGVRDQAYAIL